MLHALQGEPAEVRDSILRVGTAERALGFCVKHAAFAGERALVGDGLVAYELDGLAKKTLFRYADGPLFLSCAWAGYIDGPCLRYFSHGSERFFNLPLPGKPKFATDGRTLVFYWPGQSHSRNFLVILDTRGARSQRVALCAHHVAVDGPWLYIANKTRVIKLKLDGDWAAAEWTWATEKAAAGLAADAGVLLLGPPRRLVAALGPSDVLGKLSLETQEYAFYDGHLLWREGEFLKRTSLVRLLQSRSVAARLSLQPFLPARLVLWIITYL